MIQFFTNTPKNDNFCEKEETIKVQKFASNFNIIGMPAEGSCCSEVTVCKFFFLFATHIFHEIDATKY